MLYSSFTGELHLLRMVIDIDGWIPPTSCQASPDVDAEALRLCGVQHLLPGLAFGKTRKNSVLCQSLRNNKLNWSCCSHRLSRDKHKATWGLWADALIGSQLVHWKVLVFKNWPIWLGGLELAVLEGYEQEVLNGIVRSLLYEFLRHGYWVSSRHERLRLKVTGTFAVPLNRHPNSLFDKRHLEPILGCSQGRQLNYVHSLWASPTTLPYPEWKYIRCPQ